MVQGCLEKWPSGNRTYTEIPKKGWPIGAAHYFDRKVREEEQDRKKYEQYIKTKSDEGVTIERCDRYECTINSKKQKKSMEGSKYEFTEDDVW